MSEADLFIHLQTCTWTEFSPAWLENVDKLNDDASIADKWVMLAWGC